MKIRLVITPHAKSRYIEYEGYANIKKVTRILKSKLGAELKRGLRVDKTGASQIKIHEGLYAVVKPELTGWWTVVTFHTGEHFREVAEIGETKLSSL
jgi:hypothetical protein